MGMRVLTIMMLCLLGVGQANSQALLKGEVFAQSSRKPINEVAVLNLNKKEQATSNAKGEFAIKASLSDVLVFKSPGYRPDTLLLVSLKPLRRYLALEINTLNTVFIKGMSLREQYAQDIKKGDAVLLNHGRNTLFYPSPYYNKGLLFYPSALFSREGRNSRRFKRLIKQEELELPIDRRFNAQTITAVLPIKQPELDAFMVLYRPTLKFVKRADVEDFKSYLLDCYRKFKQLPADKRVLSSLKLQTDSLN